MENLNFRKAARRQAKIKIGLQGSSGSGKSYSALLLAYGLAGDWSKIAVIDSENNSADLYAHLGDYNVVPISAPFPPEKYVEALQLCHQHQMEVVVIDSMSHEWENLVDAHSKMPGNTFQNWGKITPRHNAFVNAILQAPMHIIGTIRSKQDYVMSEKNCKQVPEKVGLKGITRDGMDYELTVVFDIDTRHMASVSKDRTNLFVNKPDFQISADTGRNIKNWCNLNQAPLDLEPVKDINQEIMACQTLEKLYHLFKENPEFQESHKENFIQQKEAIETSQKFNSNGKFSSSTINH